MDENKNNGSFKLDELGSKSRFQAPDNYFEKLPGHVMNSIQEQESNEFQPRMRKKLFAVLAAACLLLFLFYPWLMKEPTTYPLLKDVSDAEIINFLIESEFETDEVILLLAEEGYDLKIPQSDYGMSLEETEALLEYYNL